MFAWQIASLQQAGLKDKNERDERSVILAMAGGNQITRLENYGENQTCASPTASSRETLSRGDRRRHVRRRGRR